MDLDSVIAKRHSIRSFTSKKASWKPVLEAIDAALQAPFAGNNNNLKFLIIEDEKIISKLSEFASQRWITEAGLVVLVCSDDTNLEKMYGERGRVYSRQQAGAAIEQMLLKLTDLGLASCWVGAYSDELIKEALSIPQHIQIEAIIPIGHAKKKPDKKRKKTLDTTLYWEKWGNGRRPSLFEEGKDSDTFV